MGIPLEVMRLGQDCLDRMEDDPANAEALIEHMQRSFEQFKSGIRHKSIEGSYRPTNQGREFTMTTIAIKDMSGSGFKVDASSLADALKNTDQSTLHEVLKAAGVPFGPLGISTPPAPSTAYTSAVNADLAEAQREAAYWRQQVAAAQNAPGGVVTRSTVKPGEEAPILTKGEEREAEREAERYSRVMLNWKRKAKEIAWTLVEYMGKALIIVGAVIGGVMLARWAFPVPENLQIGGAAGAE